MKRIPEPLEDYHNSLLECEPRATRRPSAGSPVVAREKGTAGWRGREREGGGEGGKPSDGREEHGERERKRDAAARVDGWFEGIWGFPESSRTREPTRAALHVALLVLISGLDSPVALRRAPLVLAPSLSLNIGAIGARIFCLAVAVHIYARARKRERDVDSFIYCALSSVKTFNIIISVKAHTKQ